MFSDLQNSYPFLALKISLYLYGVSATHHVLCKTLSVVFMPIFARKWLQPWRRCHENTQTGEQALYAFLCDSLVFAAGERFLCAVGLF